MRWCEKSSPQKMKGGEKKGLMSDMCAVISFLLDSLRLVMSVGPRFLSLMACAPVV